MSADKIAQEVRVTLKTLTTLTYSSTDDNIEDLKDLHQHLLQITNSFQSKLPKQEGLLLRPQLRKELKLARQKRISHKLQHTQELPLQVRRGRKKAAYSNRVGRKAQTLREVKADTCTTYIICIIICIGCTENTEEVPEHEK